VQDEDAAHTRRHAAILVARNVPAPSLHERDQDGESIAQANTCFAPVSG